MQSMTHLQQYSAVLLYTQSGYQIVLVNFYKTRTFCLSPTLRNLCNPWCIISSGGQFYKQWQSVPGGGEALTSEKDGYVRLTLRELQPSRTFSIAKEPKILKTVDFQYSSGAKTVKIIDLQYSSRAKVVKIIDLQYCCGATLSEN